MKRLLLLFSGLCLGAAPCAAGEITQKQGPATLEIRFDGPTPKLALALADLLTVKLTVEGRAGLRVRAPDRFAADFPWLLVELSKVERSPLGSERETWRLVYKLAPRGPGRKIALRFPNVQVRENNEDQTIRWDPIYFDVETAIAKPDRSDLRGITGIENSPVQPPAEPVDWRWPALACAILLAIPLAFGLRRVLRRRSVRTPAQLALYEWQRLVALKLPEQGRSERFITLLTLLVRQYLERQFEIPARRQTTPEFLRGLAAHTLLSAEEKQFLTSFLQQSEAVKFAHAEMSAEECHRWAEAARKFLASRAA